MDGIDTSCFSGMLGRDVFGRVRGPMMHQFMSESIPLSVSFDTVKNLPMDEWSDLNWFDAMNPRAMLPLNRALVLVQTVAKGKAQRSFREMTERLNRMDGVSDDERDAEKCAMLDRVMRSGYVWLPALAWLLEAMSWEAVAALCIEIFGGSLNESGAVNPKYKNVELGIMRENLMRHFSKLDKMLTAIFAPSAEDYDIEAQRKVIEGLVVKWASQMVFANRETVLVDTDRTLRHGFLAHILRPLPWLQNYTAHGKETQTVLRNHLVASSPGWLKVFVKS